MSIRSKAGLIETLLKNHNIPYKTQGKNITRGWVNITCPFCFNDPSFHLGISPSGGFSCWRCGAKGHVSQVIRILLKLSYSETRRLIEEYLPGEARPDRPPPKQDITLPPYIPLNQQQKDYLTKRGYGPDYLIDKYQIYSGGISGYFSYRIIIPFTEEGKVITYQGRDISGRSDNKYKNCPITESLISVKDTLYGLDFCQSDFIILVEGITDVWRLGDISASIQGKTISDRQITLLKRFRRVYVMLDEDARTNAETIASKVSCIIQETNVIELPPEDYYYLDPTKKDPGSLTPSAAAALKKIIY